MSGRVAYNDDEAPMRVELERVASALERIAAALEQMTSLPALRLPEEASQR